MLQEVVSSGVIQGPPSSPSQIASFAKKMQTIIHRCMVSVGGTLGYTPSQHDIKQTFPLQPSRRRPQEPVPDRGAHGVKRGVRRFPGGGARGGQAPVPPDMGREGHADPDFGFDATYPVSSIYIIRASPSGFRVFIISVTSPFVFRILFISGTTFSRHWEFFISSTSSSGHWEFFISGTSSSEHDEHDNEQTDVVTLVLQLGFGHRVGKKITIFTPSDWP
ncbi:hypothetical protein M9H77_28331 [Catharanthus roseus]|uniref:Uncharacterized protein n=1 Tax=Catharanthus roseus TaxID=4058 RepID=A0ACC0AHS0_CATRO|nr:hypothetical protein M9H77_28331 [Catharanthus roseus]